MARDEQTGAGADGGLVSLSPWKVFNAALAKVPGLRILFGVVAVLAIVAMAKFWSLDPKWTVVGGLVIVAFAFVLLVLSKFASAGAGEFRGPARVLMWFFVVMSIVYCLLLTSSVFFNAPLNLRAWLTPTQDSHADPAAGADTGVSAAQVPRTESEPKQDPPATAPPKEPAPNVVNNGQTPSLGLDLVCDPNPVQLGGFVMIWVEVRNLGNAADQNVKVRLSLGSEFEFVSGQGGTAVTGSGREVEFAPLATLAPRQVVKWTVRAQCVAAGTISDQTASMTSAAFPSPQRRTTSVTTQKR